MRWELNKVFVVRLLRCQTLNFVTVRCSYPATDSSGRCSVSTAFLAPSPLIFPLTQVRLDSLGDAATADCVFLSLRLFLPLILLPA